MQRLVRALPARPQPAAIRFGATAGVVALFFLALLWACSQTGSNWPSLLYPAIVLSAIMFNRGSGYVATALAVGLLYLLFTNLGTEAIAGERVAALAVFSAIAVTLAAISEGLRSGWERTAEAERMKDLLLRELGHRIRNNLAMATSLLALQARAETSAEARNALERAAGRVRAIADAHDHLESMGDDGRIEMRDYLAKLCRHLREHLGGVRPIAIEVTADETALRPDEAIGIGLIVNELVTNALKHAFPGDRTGTVHVGFSADPPLALVVEDDGVGCAKGVEGQGSRLLHLLVQQLHGTIEWEDARPGCRVRLVVARGRLGAAARTARARA